MPHPENTQDPQAFKPVDKLRPVWLVARCKYTRQLIAHRWDGLVTDATDDTTPIGTPITSCAGVTETLRPVEADDYFTVCSCCLTWHGVYIRPERP